MTELNRAERPCVNDILGYLNFSSGSYDVQFFKAWNALFESLDKDGKKEIWSEALCVLERELEELTKQGGVFADSRQAKRVLTLAPEILKKYREFHRDVLFNTVKDEYLFNPFFMARVAMLTTSCDLAEQSDREVVDEVVERLNDFLGYRPVPVLEGNEKHEPNEHEWVAPLPMYLEGAGVAFGPYRELFEETLKILSQTDDDILHDASFDMEKLRELAIDPRAYDFDHPVNRRLNYSFGTWDDRSVDSDGYFRRFIVHRATVDAIMGRVWDEKDPELRASYIYEGAAVLAGTLLMGSGVSGGHVQAHDSEVTLVSLTPIIAGYRDLFYERLLEKVPEDFKARLDDEAKRLFQPFAGVRHALNRYLAKKRADQLQRFSLARTYARMGYFEASQRQVNVIETSASRLLSQIDCLITRSRLALDSGRLTEATACLPEIEDLLHRGIACGAFPDPWFIIGFDSQFNLFPSVDSGIHDHRLDGLIDLLNDIFDLYSLLLKEAAARGDSDVRLDLSERMGDLAGWWDQFGSTEVSSVEGFSGQEVWESATKVATALAAWSQAGKAVGDVKFWQRHVKRFNSPKAFVLLCEALLDRNDLISSSSLMIYWLNQSENIPLIEGDYSFNAILFDWIAQAWSKNGDAKAKKNRRRVSYAVDEFTDEEYKERWNLTQKFIDRIEANAEENWTIPQLNLPEEKFEKKIVFKTNNPVLADLTRNLFIAAKYAGKAPNGVPKIVLKGSFRDAARSVDAQNLPSPGEFKKFYQDNRKLFPKFISFEAFAQIVLGEVRMTPEKRSFYRRQIFGEDKFASFSVSNKAFEKKDESKNKNPKLTAMEENELEQKKLWDEILKELGDQVKEPNLFDVVQHVLKTTDDEDEKKNAKNIAYDDDQDDLPGDDLDVEEEPEDDDYSDQNDDEYYEPDDEEEDEDSITGGDPTYRAAYENMSYHDSADDGTDDDVFDSKSAGFSEGGDDFEFAQETNRISDRLTFIFSTVKLWKFAAGKSPLLYAAKDAFDEETISDTEMRVEGWLDQALIFERSMYELLDQVSRYHIPEAIGTVDSLAEYDQVRGTKEILLDRIIWTIVEIEDAVLFLKATLGMEQTEKFEKPWKAIALKIFGAFLRRDAKKVKALWSELLKLLEKETLLYIPTARGGDVKAIVECRRLQQAVLRLLKYAPRLGLFYETFQLISCVQKMEQIRLSSPGSITEYDRFVEAAMRSITESLSESSRNWRTRANSSDGFATNEEALDFYLSQSLDVILKFWLSHSQNIRISSIEAIAGEMHWNILKNFVQEYGADLFTQQFLAFRNIRAILHQGVDSFLKALIEMKNDGKELENGDKLITSIIEGSESFENAANLLDATLECIAENYAEYVDYNSSTTQSDHGEKLYMLIDFLRVLANYERILWNLKPVYWVHDSLIRSGCVHAAELWKNNVKSKSVGLAEKSLRRYEELTQRYGVWLESIHGRLKERFVRPLDVAQMCGLVFDAISEVRENGEDNPVFKELEKDVENFAAELGGVGFDLPEWLSDLQDEVVLARVDSKEERREHDTKDDVYEPVQFYAIEKTSRTEIKRQLEKTINEFR